MSKKDIKKGLSALLTKIEKSNDKQERTEIVRELNSSVSLIKLSNIEVNPYQPRIEFKEEDLEELAMSIKVHGLIQPITVRSLGGDKYQIISGERRMRASKMAGLTEVPAYVRVANDQEMLEMALIENIQRADLNAIEVAISYQRLIDECKLTHENLSERVGKNRSTVTNYLRLLKLPPEIQTAVKSNTLSMGHARSLAGINDIALQLDLFKKTISNEWSVRQLENAAKDSSKPLPSKSTKSNNATSIELDRIKKELSAQLGVKVEIIRDNKGKGKIVISFGNDQQFNDIYDIIMDNQ